jgi:hypothetical protein
VSGRLIEGLEYEPRPAAYAVACGAGGSVAAVQTASGCFLPGGGSLAGETPQETVVRKELAREVCVIREIGPPCSTSAPTGGIIGWRPSSLS